MNNLPARRARSGSALGWEDAVTSTQKHTRKAEPFRLFTRLLSRNLS